MNRRYSFTLARYTQPDPYDGSYSLSDPRPFNRYAYVQNDPINFTDPSGLDGTPDEPCIGCPIDVVVIQAPGRYYSGGGTGVWT